MATLSNEFDHEINSDERSTMPRMIMAVLALAGTLNSSYLAITRWFPADVKLQCGIVGNCEAVQASIYSVFPPVKGGIPVAYLGLIGFIAMLVLSLMSLQRDFIARWAIPSVTLLIATGGLAFSAYLTSIEAWVLHEWCQWCIISAIVMTLFWLVALVDWWKFRGQRA